MLSHARIRKALSEYHDGEASRALGIHIEQHLEECSSCRREYRQVSEVTKLIRHLPRLEAPTALARLIRRRIDEEVHGMLPLLRGELLSCRSRPSLVPAVTLSAMLTLSLLAGMLLLDLHWKPAGGLGSGWAPTSLSELAGFLRVEMVSPRFPHAFVERLPFAEVERGKEGTLLTLASIDRNGSIKELRVIYRSGDERMLARTLEVLRHSGFEPARLGRQAVPVNFLYLFTTTEVRPPGKRVT